MSEIKLKPCPFCGARSVIGNGPRLTDFESLHRRIYEVQCTQCTATLNRWFDSEQEAAEAWNKRAELPSAQPEIIRCKDCEYGEQDEVGRWFCRSLGCQIGNEDGSGYCADAERREEDG